MNKNLQIIHVSCTDLNPAPYNPRRWDEAAIKHLTESIEKFGLVDPIIVNGSDARKNIVIGGHFRLRIANDLGYKTVPVVYIDIPDEAKERELNLRLNRNTGTWDFELLKSFDLDLLLDVGFDDVDLSHIWDEHLGIEDDEFDLDKAIQEIGEPQTKPGQVIQLGMHRLVCGDATDPAVMALAMGDQKADMMYFDPPFNIRLDYNKGISTAGKYGGTTDDHKSDQDYLIFLKTVLQNGLTHGATDCHVFTWCDERNIGLLQSIYPEIGLAHKRVCLWLKNNHNMTPQVAFNKVYEACVYGTRGSPYLSNIKNLNEILNRGVDTGNRMIDDVMDMLNIWLEKRKAGQEYLHPTEKPVTLHEKPLRRCTKPGDLVLDAFGGSGSTLIACEQLKRRSVLIEIEPIFCDVIIKRFQALTGQEAHHVN